MDKVKSYQAFERLRKKKKVTKSEVARETGIGKSTLTEWGKGLYMPKVDKLLRIANYFGVPLDDLLKD